MLSTRFRRVEIRISCIKEISSAVACLNLIQIDLNFDKLKGSKLYKLLYKL